MALRKVDGFDHYTTIGDTAANIAAYLQAAGYSVLNAQGTQLALVDGQDAGSTALKITNTSGSATPTSVGYSINTAANLVVFGFSFRATQNRMRIARINGQVDLDWDPADGKLEIGADRGADVIILNAWWSFEIEIDKGNNEIRVWANDTLQLTSALPGPAAGDTHTILWGLQTSPTGNSTIELDDFTVVDSTAGANVSRIGPVQAITRAPTSDITAEWNVVGSTGTHYSVAAQLAPNTVNAPYLQANIEGKKDVFGSTTVLPNNNQIFGVSTVSYARKGDLDDRALGMTVSTPAGETEIEVPLTTNNAYREAVFERAPTNIPWTQALVEVSNFGITAR